MNTRPPSILNTHLLLPISLLLALIVSKPVLALDVILDSTNNYSVEIEPGVTISRIDGQNGPMTITGGTFSFDDTIGNQSFSGEIQFGGTENQLGPDFKQRIIANAEPLIVEATSSENEYQAILTFWSREDSRGDFFGTPPNSNDPGVALELTLQEPITAIPLPMAAILLGMIGLIGIGLFRLRALNLA